MIKVSREDLETLIAGLQGYRDRGVIDPWVLDDGTAIEPLGVLQELKELRNYGAKEVEVNDWIAKFLRDHSSIWVDNEEAEVVGHEIGVFLERVKSGEIRLV